MSELEKGRLDDEAKKTIDPCFSAYSIADKYVFFQCYYLYNWE
jgi:hypothetical protein